MAVKTVSVNRAPVLTLWAAAVAERLGFDEDAALTLGRAVAALNAQSKGRRLGIFKPPDEKAEKPQPPEGSGRAEVCGRTVPTLETERGVRAVLGGETIQPGPVRRYLQRAFGAELPRVRTALRKLAAAYEPEQLRRSAYDLYEQFRPEVPEGHGGWGAKGELDLGAIRRLARRPAKARRGG